MNDIPRPEYPRPQLVRGNFTNLNGGWQFEIDNSKSGFERGFTRNDYRLSGEITLPFCPESRLSGVGNRDFMYAVWYKRVLTLEKGADRIILHIDACDYSCEVWVNGISCGHHFGGSSPISLDITDSAVNGENVITVRAEDNVASGTQPGGKQSPHFNSSGCLYTRTTGIWQTVWLEEVPEAYIKSVKYDCDIDAPEVFCEVECAGVRGSMSVEAEAFFDGRSVGKSSGRVIGNVARFTIPLSERQLWEVGNGRLYDVRLKLGADDVKSYFGLREAYYDGSAMIINHKPVFQRLVLDQGFYPDGIWTAPTDSELIADITRSQAMGFNGARLHQKVFEPRFLYHCDRLGYIVWGEHGNWGLDLSKPTCYAGFLPEWLEIMKRDYSHPSIIGWCPLNETSPNQDKRFVESLYAQTKAFDPVRPCIDCSGWYHVITDVEDDHNYDQNPDSLRAHYLPLTEGKPPLKNPHTNTAPTEKLTFISEYGGIGWSVANGGWGYGNAPKTEEEFIARFKGLTETLLQNPRISGFCYTQLTDVEQEQNGLYTYERVPKFNPSILHAILSGEAAIEK